MHKRGKLAWDLLAILAVAVLVLVVLLIFSNFIREKIVEAFGVLVETVFGN